MCYKHTMLNLFYFPANNFYQLRNTNYQKLNKTACKLPGVFFNGRSKSHIQLIEG